MSPRARRALGRALGRALADARELDHVLADGLNHVFRNLTPDRALDLDHALTSVVNQARAVTSALDLSPTYFRVSHFDLARASALDLDLARASIRDLDRALGLALALDLDLGLGLDLIPARTRALDLIPARTRALDLDRDLVRARELARDLADIGRAQQEPGRVAPLAARLLSSAARLLPAADRARYAEEYRCELWELAQAGTGRLGQLGYALRQLRSAPRTGRALRSPQRRGAAP